MPSTSRAQQRFMGIVHGLQKGTVKPSSVSKKAQDVAKHIAPSDATAFASTKHKGLPKKKKVKEQLMQGQLGQVYAVKKPYSGCELTSLIHPIDPLVGMGAGHEIVPDEYHGVFSDEESAQAAANELYEAHLEHENMVEEKKGKAVDGLKKAIDKLEKKRKEHVDMAKEDPKSAGKHKEHIAHITSQLDDLMSKMERVEKAKKPVKDEEKEDLKEGVLNEMNPELFHEFVNTLQSNGFNGFQIAGIMLLVHLSTLVGFAASVLGALKILDVVKKAKQVFINWNEKRKINPVEIKQLVSDFESKANSLEGGKKKFFLGILNKLKRTDPTDKNAILPIKRKIETLAQKYDLKEGRQKDTYSIADRTASGGRYFFIYNNNKGTQSGYYKTEKEAKAALDKKLGVKKEKVKESKKSPGLWANINAKHKRGEAPAKKGTEAYKKAVSAAKKINSDK